MPNTRFLGIRMEVVPRPVVYLDHAERGRLRREAPDELSVVALDNVPISSVGFFDGKRQIGPRPRNVDQGSTSATWRPSGAGKGHTLTAVVSDTRGREAEAARVVRVCR